MKERFFLFQKRQFPWFGGRNPGLFSSRHCFETQRCDHSWELAPAKSELSVGVKPRHALGAETETEKEKEAEKEN